RVNGCPCYHGGHLRGSRSSIHKRCVCLCACSAGGIDCCARPRKAARTREEKMTDVPTRTRGPDRTKVARFQGYKPFYLAEKFHLTLPDARELIKRVGKDRVKLNAAAKRLARRLKQRTELATASEPKHRKWNSRSIPRRGRRRSGDVSA